MADRFISNLECYLLKVQSDNETKQDSLAENDFVQVFEESTCDHDIAMEEINTVSGVFDQDAAVPGTQSAPCTLIFPIRSFGTGIRPDFMKGFECADFVITENDGYYIATPSSLGGYSGTIWHYNGKGATTNLYKMYRFIL